ncbi:response regulator transcription factor [Kitasatospora sp. NPDC058170]|uniref:response regulator transcription factor n=1 Tax=Kitasatospora sp. NPDC058170 TaxID=3346364 RepID=UPI0036DD5072
MRLLIVEDGQSLAHSLSEGLSAEGYTVDLAFDGRRGLELAQSEPYSAIVLDLMLPGLSGFAICRELRRTENFVPVLMLTAKNGEYDEAESLDCGADDFLGKPFSYIVLTARLRALLRRGSGPRPAVLSTGDLLVDPAARRCTVGGRRVRLTAKEFAVLECLARHPGQVVAKTAILDTVWDTAHRGDANIVEVYIAALRRKLNLPDAHCGIETVRGAGYRLVPDAR